MDINRCNRLITFKNDCDLSDIPSTGNKFTWRRSMNSESNTYEKLDRILVMEQIIGTQPSKPKTTLSPHLTTVLFHANYRQITTKKVNSTHGVSTHKVHQCSNLLKKLNCSIAKPKPGIRLSLVTFLVRSRNSTKSYS